MNKKWLYGSVGTLFIVIIGLSLIEDNVDVEKKKSEKFFPSVSVVEVSSSGYKGEIKTFAQINPRWSATLKTHVSGEIITFNPQALAGKQVKEGEILLKIESSRYKNQLDLAKQNLEEAKLELLLEEKKSQTALKNWKRSGIKGKPSDLTLNIPQIKIAKTRVEAGLSQLKSAKKDYENTIIKAPFSGFITNRYISLGQTISEGDTLFDIINDEQLDITLSLTSNQWDLLDQNWSV
ncbi:MAG: biotin/lipoyl-binding protein, partial [Campylobacterales bacterium]|nr:biotin/lipoyl-binding protein [Campylobacterales bacterium]